MRLKIVGGLFKKYWLFEFLFFIYFDIMIEMIFVYVQFVNKYIINMNKKYLLSKQNKLCFFLVIGYCLVVRLIKYNNQIFIVIFNC